MNGDQAREVAYWQETGWPVTRCEVLLADGTVEAWTEPPFGETRYPGEDAPDHNPICDCPALFPAAFCVECGELHRHLWSVRLPPPGRRTHQARPARGPARHDRRIPWWARVL
ncbi:hypothetical protein [Streptomyces cinereoruber]